MSLQKDLVLNDISLTFYLLLDHVYNSENKMRFKSFRTKVQK
jgi:hypothetical protein